MPYDGGSVASLETTGIILIPNVKYVCIKLYCGSFLSTVNACCVNVFFSFFWPYCWTIIQFESLLLKSTPKHEQKAVPLSWKSGPVINTTASFLPVTLMSHSCSQLTADQSRKKKKERKLTITCISVTPAYFLPWLFRMPAVEKGQ